MSSKFIPFIPVYKVVDNMVSESISHKQIVFEKSDGGMIMSTLSKPAFEVNEDKVVCIKEVSPLDRMHDQFCVLSEKAVIKGRLSTEHSKHRYLMCNPRFQTNPPLIPADERKKRKDDKEYVDWRMEQWKIIK
jgi:hypothetical protein